MVGDLLLDPVLLFVWLRPDVRDKQFSTYSYVVGFFFQYLAVSWMPDIFCCGWFEVEVTALHKNSAVAMGTMT